MTFGSEPPTNPQMWIKKNKKTWGQKWDFSQLWENFWISLGKPKLRTKQANVSQSTMHPLARILFGKIFLLKFALIEATNFIREGFKKKINGLVNQHFFLNSFPQMKLMADCRLIARYYQRLVWLALFSLNFKALHS